MFIYKKTMGTTIVTDKIPKNEVLLLVEMRSNLDLNMVTHSCTKFQGDIEVRN